ncbi:hypothetical protein [Sporosarcina ureae]|uniref:hypothetical protein n=1 Tax=Sporosarcina ureae TaxID=1571 RepID=UPI0009DC7DCA|nr:hypothetical protein [Sporosarcina ureae]ARF18684.1 hypothetical protein SporoP17a_16135 [Sporosarcina ureae]
MNDIAFWVLIALMGGIVISSIANNRNNQLKKDITHMKHTLDNIAKQVGVPDPINDELKETLLKFISEGEKVKAVKEYRMATGAELLEAKQYIDYLSER